MNFYLDCTGVGHSLNNISLINTFLYLFYGYLLTITLLKGLWLEVYNGLRACYD